MSKTQTETDQENLFKLIKTACDGINKNFENANVDLSEDIKSKLKKAIDEMPTKK